MKLCIDPGHGMSSRITGVYDTGAKYGQLEEADLVLVFAHELKAECIRLGVPVFMTRTAVNEPAPLRGRVAAARFAGCTHLISLHINDADEAKANGFETLYRTSGSLPFARLFHAMLLPALGLRDRGVKHRPDLAVLATGKMPSLLLELGFIRNAKDMAIVTNPGVMQQVCKLIAERLVALGK
jgi:N-acetylmuramoyl-L-alanine amidase